MENESQIMKTVYKALRPSPLCSMFGEPCLVCIEGAIKDIGEAHPVSEQLIAIKDGEADNVGLGLLDENH